MSRFFYKDVDGEVFEYDDEDSFHRVGKLGQTRMSDQEVLAHLTSPPPTDEDIDRLRRVAYADPLTGSDRFLTEAAAERLDGNEAAAKVAEQKCITRRAQIAKELPWCEVK